jgi:hypothetical protein
MRNKVLLGLFAVFIALMMMGGAQACAGGKGSEVYVDEVIRVAPGEYASKEIRVGSADNIDFSKKGDGVLLLFTEDEMVRYEADEDYTPLLELNGSGDQYDNVRLEPGSYHVVLDNSDGVEPASADVLAVLPGDKCGEPDIAPLRPWFIPSFPFELAAVAMAVGLTLGMAARRR